MVAFPPCAWNTMLLVDLIIQTTTRVIADANRIESLTELKHAAACICLFRLHVLGINTAVINILLAINVAGTFDEGDNIC